MQRNRKLMVLMASVVGGVISFAATVYIFYYVMKNIMFVSDEQATMVLIMMNIVAIPAMVYSFWLLYKQHRSGDDNYVSTKMEKMVMFTERDYKLIYWFLSLLFIPLFSTIYFLMLWFGISTTIGIFYNISSIKHIDTIIIATSVLFAIITYYKIGDIFRGKTK